MRVLQLFIEIIFIGSLAILAFNHLYALPVLSLQGLAPNQLSVTFTFIILAWVVGFFINILADILISPLYRRIEERWMLREGNPQLVLERLRYDLYVRASGKDIVQRIEYQRSLIRLSRCILLGAVLYSASAVIIGNYYQAALSLIIIIFASSAYYKALIWSIKSTYYAWSSVKQSGCFKSTAAISPAAIFSENQETNNVFSNTITAPDEDRGVHIVAFTGGTGFRDINMLLAQKTQNISRIVPIWDNGGSSKALRESFNLMPVGDIRHALMTQAHGEGRVGSIVKLFNWRLPDTGNNKKLLTELESFINNQHPLMKSLDPCLGNVIVNYLKRFYESLPVAMDLAVELSMDRKDAAGNENVMELKNGSIGNFVLVGSYLAHNKDINTAIYVFRQLCSIHGNVWPVSTANDLHINACLEDGQMLLGQSKTTTIDRSKSNLRIKTINFSDDSGLKKMLLKNKGLKDEGLKNKGLKNKCQQNKAAQRKDRAVSVPANPMVLDALQKAEVIVFGPGSFFTSVLPHVMVDGIADMLSELDVPKVFIGNLLEDSECYGYTLEEIIELFLTSCNQHATIKRPANKYITHIIAHSSYTMTEYTHNDRHYLLPGENIKRFNNDGISIIINDFENPWKRGAHDPVCITDYLLNIAHSQE